MHNLTDSIMELNALLKGPGMRTLLLLVMTAMMLAQTAVIWKVEKLNARLIMELNTEETEPFKIKIFGTPREVAI